MRTSPVVSNENASATTRVPHAGTSTAICTMPSLSITGAPLVHKCVDGNTRTCLTSLTGMRSRRFTCTGASATDSSVHVRMKCVTSLPSVFLSTCVVRSTRKRSASS